jgi:hypothetical protein
LLQKSTLLAKCLRAQTASSNGRKPQRAQPLVVELELYFSCLVKKFVHFHETAPLRDTVAVSDKLAVFFRPVTSTACSFEVADLLGRQSEIELDTPNCARSRPSGSSSISCAGRGRGITGSECAGLLE